MKHKNRRGISSTSDWMECSGCNSLILETDTSFHLTESMDDHSHQHGFIHDNKLYAPWNYVPQNSMVHSHFILLHPETMQHLNLQTNQYVRVISMSTERILHVLPGKTVMKSTVLLSNKEKENLYLNKEDLISVEPFDEKIHNCDNLKIISMDDQLIEPEDQSFICNKLQKEIISDSQIVILSHCIKKLKIQLFVPHAGNELHKSFNKLCINESLDESPIKSTPNIFTTSTPKRPTSSENISASASFMDMYLRPKTAYYLITNNTKIYFSSNSIIKENKRNLSWENIGGMKTQIKCLQQILNLLFLEKGSINQIPKGILLHGPHGCGKTMIGDILQSLYTEKCIKVRGPELFCKYQGETESKLKAKFSQARHASPSILFIDEIDCLTNVGSVSSSLMSNFDDINSGDCLVIACTSNPDSIPSSLRIPGRLEKEIQLNVPIPSQRKEILEILLRNISHELSEKDLEVISDGTHGFVGSDLKYLVTETILQTASSGKITLENVLAVQSKIKPSAMRAVLIEVPKVKWDDIGGGSQTKLALQQALTWPLTHPQAFVRLGITPPRGILLYGPPGCSKTMIAKAVANEAKINFLAVKGAELLSKYVGESERAVRELFRKARQVSPSIIFFDELDALASCRTNQQGGGGVSERVLSQLLTEIDGVTPLSQVTILAATNRPDMIDDALLRPGRLDRQIYIPLPDPSTRKEIFKLQFKKTPVADDVNIDFCVSTSEGYSGAEIISICQEAALNALQSSFSATAVKWSDFENAFKKVKPRITQDTIEFYETYNKSR